MFLKISDKKKRYLLLAGSFLALVLILVAVVMAVGYMLHRSFGWFSSNTLVTNTGASVKTSIELFELSAVKVEGNADESKNIEQRSGFTAVSAGGDDLIMDYLHDEDNGGYDVLQKGVYGSNYVNMTDVTNTAIFFRFSNEKTDSEEIKPGDFGKLSFDIIKKVDGPLNLEITFNARGVKNINDETAEYPFVFLEDIETKTDGEAAAIDMLKGHILFFREREAIAGSDEYHYSGILESGTFTYNTADYTPITDVGDGRDHYRIDIYWIWPSTYAQLVFEEGSPKLNNTHALFASDAGGNAARSEMIAYMEDYGEIQVENPAEPQNPNYFFYNCSYGFDEDFKTAKFIEYSDGYNNADQIIGDNVNYIIADVSVSHVPETPSGGGSEGGSGG